MKKTILITALMMVSFITLMGQVKVMMTNGEVIEGESIKSNQKTITVKGSKEEGQIPKSDVLCVIPNKGKAYTFWQKNNRKLKISKKDIVQNYAGNDIARIFAYKYYKSNIDAWSYYKDMSTAELSEEDFNAIFNQQSKTIRSKMTVGYVISGIVIVLSLGLFIGTLQNAAAVSYNDLPTDNFDNRDLPVLSIPVKCDYLYSIA